MKYDITGHNSINIDAPVERVWAALTDPALIKKYFHDTDAESDWKPGSPIRWTGQWQGRPYEDKGRVYESQPNRLLKHDYWSSRWEKEQPDKPENYVMITYELQPEGDRTVLLVTQENIPTEEMRVHAEQGWDLILGGMKKMLEEMHEHAPA
ncbi:SRPBCC family protein [Sediminibacterium soli]|uniref:SRPBCC family protein n=1 Tax=Sediminibacterium soli TaxID=2698829 RepID=UPI001379B0FD|nr:SRPBCC family protein [Sediminibacterium soli]NCI46919.1 SRPBCC domain-containing protein [Sediminibacterium soli]